MRRLFAALRAIGPVTLLRVCASGEVPPGRVVWRGEGLMQGTLPHFAPYAAATDADLAGWLAVCGRAYALRHSLVEPPALAPDGPPLFTAPENRPPRPRRRRADPGILVTGRPVSGLRGNRLHVVAAEIRLPRDFSGTRAALTFVEAAPHARREADPACRGTWQTIYTATRTRKRQTEATTRPDPGRARGHRGRDAELAGDGGVYAGGGVMRPQPASTSIGRSAGGA